MGQALSDKQTLRFDLSNGNISDPFTFDQWGTIKTCTALPGPNNYNLKQCAVVINEVIFEKLRFFVYDERFDELIELYETTTNVQQVYRKIHALLTSTQPENLRESLKAVLGCRIEGRTRSYLLDKIETNYSKVVSQSLLCRGDLIARRMNTYVTWHYGVYFDDNKVYHWCSQKSNSDKSKGRFSRTSLAEFMGNKHKLYVEYDIIQIYSPESKENRAKGLLQSVYNVWNNNCEHLANEICRGKKKCSQLPLCGESNNMNYKCMDCKAWNYGGPDCNVSKACKACKQKWNDYLNAKIQRQQQELERQQNLDNHQRAMDALMHDYNSLSNSTYIMPSFNSSSLH